MKVTGQEKNHDNEETRVSQVPKRPKERINLSFPLSRRAIGPIQSLGLWERCRQAWHSIRWADIYGLRVGKCDHGAYLKDPNWFPLPPNGVNSIIGAIEADHARVRRLVSHAFSDNALRSQEYIIQLYVDLLVQRLHEQIHGKANGVVDMVRWYNFTTFDMIADLTFGESFHCLRHKDYHPWVSMAFQTIVSYGFISMKRYFPIWAQFVKLLEPKATLKFRREFFRFVDSKVAWRMSTETTRPDFIIMRH